MPQLSAYQVLQPLLLAAAFVMGMVLMSRFDDKSSSETLWEIEQRGDQSASRIGEGRVEEIIRFVESKYVDNIDSDSMINRALKQVFLDLDPHSRYMSKEELHQDQVQMQGAYTGIGIETIDFRDSMVVTHVLPDSPAQLSGIAKFDIILAVLDSIENKPTRENLKRKQGEEIHLKILKYPYQLPEDTIIVKVDNIAYKTVEFATLNDSTLYVNIGHFNSVVYNEFMKGIETFMYARTKTHLVIDVRNNPGGYLPEVTNILSQLFREKDRLLVWTEGQHSKATEYKSTGKRFYNIEDVIVLVNEGSASGSEVLAGAIQDWDRGLVVGRRTFGKGLVQEQYELKNGGAIRITTAKYYTPTGRCIQKPYQDKSTYNDDLENRFLNGEFFDDKNVDLVDSTIFETKLLQRQVFAHGGIIPDIFVPLDTNYMMILGPEANNVTSSFIYDQLRKSDFDNSLEVDENTLWQSFKNYCHENNEEQLWRDIKPYSDRESKRLLGKYYKMSNRDSMGNSLIYYHDPMVQEGIRQLAENPPSEILQLNF